MMLKFRLGFDFTGAPFGGRTRLFRLKITVFLNDLRVSANTDAVVCWVVRDDAWQTFAPRSRVDDPFGSLVIVPRGTGKAA